MEKGKACKNTVKIHSLNPSCRLKYFILHCIREINEQLIGSFKFITSETVNILYSSIMWVTILLASIGISLSGLIISVTFYGENIKECWKETLISSLLIIPVFMCVISLSVIVPFGLSALGIANEYILLVLIISMPIMTTPIFLYKYIVIPLYYLLFRKKEMNPEYTKLLTDNDCHGKVFVIKNSNIACTMGITKKSQIIMIGSNLIENLSKDEYTGILLHEIGHIKYKHLRKLILIDIVGLYITMLTGFLASYSSNKNPYVIVAAIGLSGGLITFLRIIMKQYEKQADGYAAQIIGADTYISALTKLNGLFAGRMDKYDIEHPRLKDRIENIKKCCKNRH